MLPEEPVLNPREVQGVPGEIRSSVASRIVKGQGREYPLHPSSGHRGKGTRLFSAQQRDWRDDVANLCSHTAVLWLSWAGTGRGNRSLFISQWPRGVGHALARSGTRRLRHVGSSLLPRDPSAMRVPPVGLAATEGKLLLPSVSSRLSHETQKHRRRARPCVRVSRRNWLVQICGDRQETTSDRSRKHANQIVGYIGPD